MASNYPMDQAGAQPIQTGMASSRERGITHILHTGALCPFRVDIHLPDSRRFPMVREKGNIWSCAVPSTGYIYRYEYYINPNVSAAYLYSRHFRPLPVNFPLEVHHDVLLNNLPTAYFSGLALHLQHIYDDLTEANIKSRLAELEHILHPHDMKKVQLTEYLPGKKTDLKENTLLMWIIGSIRKATSTCQLTFLTVLLAQLSSNKLHSGLDVLCVFDKDDLRKLINSLQKACNDWVDWSSQQMLEMFVTRVLEVRKESHWLYVALYCYPFFNQYKVSNFKFKNNDKPPTNTQRRISHDLLPHLNDHRDIPGTSILIEKVEKILGMDLHKNGDSASDAKRPTKDEEKKHKTESQETVPTAVAQETVPTQDDAIQWNQHRFSVLLEAEEAKVMGISIYEDGLSSEKVEIPMKLEKYDHVLEHKQGKTTWWKGYAEVELPVGPCYKYKYYEVKMKGMVRSFIGSFIGSESVYKEPETEERVVRSTFHEDIYQDKKSSSLEKSFIGHVLYELEQSRFVINENLDQLLSTSHATELHWMTGNLPKRSCQEMQSHITDLICNESNMSDAKIVFLARLLGNCTQPGGVPSLKTIAGKVLAAFKECRLAILPFMQREKPSISSDLINIVLNALRQTRGGWLDLVFYTYPAVSAQELCKRYKFWKPEATSLSADCQEEVLSNCCKMSESKDAEKLLSHVFESITEVPVLLKVLKQHEHSPLFQDKQTGYKRWVKNTVKKQIDSLKKENFDGIHDIWKMVADMSVETMELLTRELVLNALAHSNSWSNDAENFVTSWFDDESFWETKPTRELSESFRSVLKKILTSKGEGHLDTFLEVISKRWVTKWLTLNDLESLVTEAFTVQLKQCKGQPAQTVDKMYVFLGALQSVRWIDGLPDLITNINEMAMKFINKENQLSTLLRMIFLSSKEGGKVTSKVDMEEVKKHAVQTIQNRKMTSLTMSKLLAPYAHNGQLDVHSELAADVLTACIDDVAGDHPNLSSILDNGIFWELIFQAKGEAASKFQCQEKYKAVLEEMRSVEQAFLEKSVTVKFVSGLSQESLDDLLSLCQMATYHPDEESAAQRDQSFQDVLPTIQSQKENLKLIEGFFSFYERFPNNTFQDEMKIFQKEVLRRRMDVDPDSDVPLVNLVADGYWGDLLPILEAAREVEKIQHAKVFFNMCLHIFETESVLSELTSGSDENDEDASDKDTDDEEEDSEPATDEEASVNDGEENSELANDTEEMQPRLLVFAKLLSDKCLPEFKKLCHDISQGCRSVTVGNIKCMFNGVMKGELPMELNRISVFIEKSIGEQSKQYLNSWVNLERNRQYAKQLQCLFTTFEVHDQESCTLLHDVETVLTILDPSHDTVLLQDVHRAMQRIEEVDGKFSDEDWRAITELIHSQRLIHFLKPIIDDDLRNLTDAVEERSDSFINESTVSDLIEVQRYMGSFLRISVLDTPEKLINAIAESRQLGIKKISDKIKTCNEHFHALKNLYTNIAQRGEMTKKIIHNALQKGFYKFVLQKEEVVCEVSMSYFRDDGSVATFQQDELDDLRSRALLMVNSRITEGPLGSQEESSISKELQEFIQSIDEVNEIVDLCSGLANAGHYEFTCFKKEISDAAHLNRQMRQLKEDSLRWTDILTDARRKFFFLNFFHSKQLWLLDQFFRGKSDVNIDDIINLFHYVSSGICVDRKLTEHYKEPEEGSDVGARLFATGEALEKIFANEVTTTRDIVYLQSTQAATIDNTVQPGNIFVAELDTDSTNSIPVLMTLLKNTTGKYPQANHVLFCHPETAWVEVHLLLQRCQNAPQRETTQSLYSLINVEQLTTEVQLELVDEMKKLQETDVPFLLAVICRGGCHHHIIDQFSPHFTHQIQGMTANDMRYCLTQGWPDVEVITSEVPGLGKSEYAACKAAERGKNTVLFEMGGPLTKKSLVQQLLQKRLSDYHMLHVDIRPTSDPSLVDSFIFEALVVGMVVAGTHLCELKHGEVFIEIANTQQNHLRNSLTNCSNFKRHDIEWDDYGSFLVSQEINSPVQVVCHYLKALKGGSLDSKQIILTGQSQEKPLLDDQCRQLLKEHFSPTSKMAYTTINMFLSVLATELKKMSASHFFTIEGLREMLGAGPLCVRSDLLKALDAVAQEFSSRSVQSGETQLLTGRDAVDALNEASQGPSVSAKQMVERVKGMVQWADSNHLMVVFNQQDTQTCSALYRLLSQVPQSVKNLFENQLDKKLPNYQAMSQDQLQTVLERICRDSRDAFKRSQLGHLETTYALTPDNMMKMVLIHMRVKSRVPVVVMGETGCGKTTLITFLARICQVLFYVQNFHAGISKETILDYICKMKKKAKADLSRQIWCFLDEINTCDHLGLLSEIICHHKCLGEQLPYNLVFLAACNPYSLRKGKTSTSGLTGKLVQDEQSKLVYRVHPLPESLMDYVWDYGALNAKDEEAYTRRMVNDVRKDLIPLFVDLLIMSQQFIKDTMENKYCVSLRDINRCQYLAMWMTDMLGKKGPAKLKSATSVSKDNEIRAIILSLAHCYHSRLTLRETRKQYREKIAKIFQGKHHHLTEADIEEVIREEQLDILNRMELEEGIAKNEALRENVFVVLISILNRIPVFLVGKPGCSKSLSMQLIRSNLRGPDSKDKYFKKLPAVYVVSYQGSESSTSEGITKVFEKAKRYKEHNPDIIPVVLLDEIGLAENSSFNPLKVLHSLLEPSTGDFPEMAVVGISNWALDAAKMNRAVHLSRPEPNADDLFETAKSIHDESMQRRSEQADDSPNKRNRNDQQLKKLAAAYHEYQNNQSHENFHGLRDYYSLIKSIAMPPTKEAGLTALESGFRRNFGGIRSDKQATLNAFMDTMDVGQNPDLHPSTLDLIKDNLEDKHARHLMLITSGDSALSIIEKILHESKKRNVILPGSRFDDDISEEYNYRILSKIILCMEEGYILVLRDLENVYSSLYDMLNQNYTYVGKKRHCRVALGAYSNPMCQVHEDFRCIVIIDQKNVDYSDPPLLNRFEKQTLTFMDIVSDEQKQAIDMLDKWVEDVSTINGMQFSPCQAFLGFHNDTLPSLVSFRCQERDTQNMDFRKIADMCKDDLVRIATPDAVLRSSKSELASSSPDELAPIQERYLQLPLNGGLKQVLQNLFSDQARASLVDGAFQMCPLKLIVYTYSTIHVDLVSCLDGLISVHSAKLSQYKSERHLTDALQLFMDGDKQIFILQCKTSLDAQHMLLAKCLIDNRMAEYAKAGSSKGVKHVCIVVHVERDQNVKGEATLSFPWQFNFLCGWEQVTLDTLEQPKLQLTEVIKMSVAEICAKSVDIVSVIKDKLLWCFSCISFEGQCKDVPEVLKLIRSITECPDLLECFSRRILSDIQEEVFNEDCIDKTSWQVAVSCEHELLCECASFISALTEHVKRRIANPLFKIVFFLEQNNAWNSYMLHEEIQATWKSMFMNPSVFDVRAPSLQEPKGVESCKMGRIPPAMDFPFFNRLYVIVEDHLKCLLTDAKTKLVVEHASMDHDEITEKLTQVLYDRLPEAIAFDVANVIDDGFLSQHLDLYLNDLCNVFSSKHVGQMQQDVRVPVTRLLVQRLVQGLGLDQGLTANAEVSNWHIALAMNAELLWAELQILHIYQQATGEDPLELLMSFLDPVQQDGTAGSFCLQNGMDPEDDDQSEALDSFFDASGDIPDSETESFVSAQESYYGCSEGEREHVAEDSEEGSLKFQLVSAICKALLPSRRLLTSTFKSQKTWMRFANNILLSAASIEVKPKEFHFLHFCKDFVNLLALPSGLPDDYLAELGELICGLADNTLDSEEILHFVQKTVTYVHEEVTNESDRAKQHLFLTRYFVRCLEANVETPLLADILSSLISENGDLIEGSRLVMRCVITSEMDIRDTVYREVICEGVNQDDNSENLAVLDKILTSLPDGVNSHFATLCCDLIEECGFSNLTCHKVMTGSISELEPTLMRASRILGTFSDCSLQLVCAVAFLNKFLHVLSQIAVEHGTTGTFLQSEDGHFLIRQLGLLAAFLKGCERPVEVQHWILRYLSQQTTPSHSNQLVSVLSRPAASFEGVRFRDGPSSSLACYSPMNHVDEYSEVRDALAGLKKQGNKAGMKPVIGKLDTSPKHRLAFLAVLVDYYYLASISKDLTASDRSNVEWIVKQVDGTNVNNKAWYQLLKRVSGITDFKRKLQLSRKSEIEDVQLSSVLMHIAAVVVSEDQQVKRSFFQHLFNPSLALRAAFFPAAKKQTVTKTASTRTAICHCGLQFVQRLLPESRQDCPSCGKRLVMSDSADEKSNPNNSEDPMAYSCPPALDSWHTLEETAGISVASRLIIDFLVHGCLYVVSEIFPGEFQEVNLCPVSEVESRLMELWSILPAVLRANLKDASVLLHYIIKEITPALTSTQYTCNSAAERDEFELYIHQEVEKILQTATSSQQQFLADSYIASGLPVDSIEHQMQELDDMTGNGFKLLPRSSRQKRQPTLDDLRACFCNSHSQNVENYPFLHLVLSRCNALKYVSCLPTLLSWNFLVSSCLSQRQAKRIHASKAIRSLITTDQNLSEHWSAFQEAFNKVCDNWTELTGETKCPDLINLESEISECLIVPKPHEENTLGRMIKILQGIQNSFLTEALEIAATKDCPAVSFLIKDDNLAALSTKPLNQVRERDVIFPNIDQCICHHDVNTEYGHGAEISYDFKHIEMNVALSTIVNKVILTDGGIFKGFIFADDLYHSSTTILEEVAVKVRQEILPKDMTNLVIQGDKRKCGTFTNDLLQTVEVVMGLLKRTSGDPEVTVENFIKNWSQIIAIESPELLKSIKLKHIVALYQQLEVLLSAATIQTLGKEYRVKLPFKSQHELEKCCMDHPPDVVVRFRDIFKRFVFRYLRARQGFEPDCQVRLRDILEGMAGYEIVLPLLHKDTRLCHVVCLLEFFDKAVKQKEDKVLKVKKKTSRRAVSSTSAY